MTPRKTIAYAVLCMVWGSTWMAIRILVEQVPPIRSAALRFALAVLVLTPILALGRLRLPTRRVLIINLVLSATMIALPYALIFWAETRVPSGVTAVLFALMPLVAGLYANHMDTAVRGGKMPHSAMVALLLGVAGIVLVVSSAFSASRDQAVGAMVVLVAVVSAGISSVYAKDELQGVHPLMSTFVQLGGAAILLSFMSAVVEHGQPSNWNVPSVVALLFLSVGASVFAFPLYFWLLKEMEAYQVGTIQWFEPLVAVVEGAILLHEPLSWLMLLGCALVLASVVRVMTAGAQDDATVTIKITG